ncbi:RnfABCDGE type electron transport complex subunit D [Granulosicoccus sp. 3-233]|uniref:RnfABCDGE type electron transport complex subunit D n=1 Tax=Granulosicoccus sp. 3-233 TaxID=3417969 RepID=UPI003D33F4FC
MSTLAPDTKAIALQQRRVHHIMLNVMLALLPGTLLQAWLIDDRVLQTVPIAMAAALLFEAAALRLRGKALRPSLADGSILLAAWLLALCLPPSLPVWQLVVGIFVMVMLGKHLYGGLGHNPFNPAMVAYAVLIISFPVTMSDWQARQHTEVPASQTSSWDGISGATPLDQLRQIRVKLANSSLTALSDSPSVPAANADPEDTPANTGAISTVERNTDTQGSLPSYQDRAQDLIMNSNWMWVNLAWLAGGIYLLLMRVISWHVPLAVLSGIALMYLGLAAGQSSHALPLIPALLSGAIMLGAFFIATDPVTAAASRRGKLVYGAGVGILTVVIREFSSYPEGLAFAVLLMNTGVPLIDYLITGPAGRSRSSAP